MSSTHFLERFARDMQLHAQETAARSAAEPNDFWLSVAADNQKQAARDALRDLGIECARERGELIDLRFIGPQARGALMLDAFLKIFDPINKALKATAWHLRHGAVEGRVGADVAEELNLQLSGINTGSTRIILTGNGSEDLTGSSLLRDSLTQAFMLLSSSDEGFYDAVDAVGGRAAQHFGEALKAIEAANLTAQFTWESMDRTLCWHGSVGEMSRIRTLLAKVSAPQVYQESIAGIVAGMSERGKLDLRTNAGRVRVRFPLDLIPVVQALRIAAPAEIRVQTSRFFDPVTRREILQHQMLGLANEASDSEHD